MAYSPPVRPTSRLTSGFGMRPGRRSGRPTFHAGIDLRAQLGDPVYAVAPGTVRVVGSDAQRGPGVRTNGYGHVIGLEHAADGFWSVYAHLSQVLVREGQRVEAGALIGRAGATSNGKFRGMGTHLHFEIREPRTPARPPFPGPYRRFNVDPETWLRERGIEVRESVRVTNAAWAQPLRGLGDVAAEEAQTAWELDYEGLPEEPVRDPETFDPPSALAIVAVGTAASITVGGALAIGAVALRARSPR